MGNFVINNDIKYIIYKFNNLKTQNDLEKNNLSLFDLQVIYELIKNLIIQNYGITFVSSVVKWFKNLSSVCNINIDTQDGINYIIKIVKEN